MTNAEKDCVLVVDDESFSRLIISRQMREVGDWEVLTAKDGADALSILIGADGGCVRLVVTDLNMPVMNGLELLRSVRIGIEQIRRDLPIMLITGHTDMHLVNKAIHLDADGFLAKPQSKVALESRIAKVLKGGCRLKPVREYLRIDLPTGLIASSNQELNKPQEITMTPITAPAKMDGNDAMAVAIDEVAEGTTLAADLRLSDGTLIVKAGQQLSSSLIEKLTDLSALDGKLKTVWIKPK